MLLLCMELGFLLSDTSRVLCSQRKPASLGSRGGGEGGRRGGGAHRVQGQGREGT